jgi:hypothetical protein
MAVEAKRGCGFRKVSGTYLVGSGTGVPCDRLPIPLTICPCCSQGIKQTRGWTWLDVNLLVGGVHRDCQDSFPCPLCMATSDMGKTGLLWIGEKFYPTVQDFMREAAQLGISRRLSAVPRDFKLGTTWVLLAHPKAVVCPVCGGTGMRVFEGETERKPCGCKDGRIAGVFHVFRPHAVERIVTETESKDAEAMDELKRRGISPVVVPDDDQDHRGSAYETNGEVQE